MNNNYLCFWKADKWKLEPIPDALFKVKRQEQIDYKSSDVEFWNERINMEYMSIQLSHIIRSWNAEVLCKGHNKKHYYAHELTNGVVLYCETDLFDLPNVSRDD